MPYLGQTAPIDHELSAAIANTFGKRNQERDLAYEVAELRKEIAELRAELAPVPTLIITGRDALDEFKRLAHAIP